MPDHPLRKLLSGILHGGDPDRVEIAYIHRGVPGDTVKIKGSEIVHVGKGWFLLSDRETQIPFHRILYVKDEKGSLVWKKRTQPKV